MEKKRVWCFLILSLLIVNSFSLISSLSFGEVISRGPIEAMNVIEEFVGPFFASLLDTDTYDQYFFSKSLVLILLIIVIYVVLGKVDLFKDKTGVKSIISFVISVIGMRYITEIDFIQGILLPYSVLAVAITMGLTFIIFGFFINDLPNASARRLGWILFIGIFLGIWYDRASQLSRGANITYAIFIVLSLVTILFDRQIHEYLGLRESKDAYRRILQAKLADMETRLERLRGATLTTNIRRTIENMEKDYQRTSRKLNRL